MNGYSPENYKLGNIGVVGAAQTDLAITKEFPITAWGSRYLVVAVKCSAVTVAVAITAKLQTGVDGNFFDSKPVSVTADGTFFIKFLPERAVDQTYLPLLSRGRVVITTGAGDTATIDTVNVIQEL